MDGFIALVLQTTGFGCFFDLYYREDEGPLQDQEPDYGPVTWEGKEVYGLRLHLVSGEGDRNPLLILWRYNPGKPNETPPQIYLRSDKTVTLLRALHPFANVPRTPHVEDDPRLLPLRDYLRAPSDVSGEELAALTAAFEDFLQKEVAELTQRVTDRRGRRKKATKRRERRKAAVALFLGRLGFSRKPGRGYYFWEKGPVKIRYSGNLFYAGRLRDQRFDVMREGSCWATVAGDKLADYLTSL